MAEDTETWTQHKVHEQGHLNWARLFKNKPNIQGKVGFNLLWCLGFYLPWKHAMHTKLSTASAVLSTEVPARTGYKKIIWSLSSFQQEFLILDITKLFCQSCCFPRPSSKSSRAWKCQDSVMSFVIRTYCKFSEQTHIHKQHSRKHPAQAIMWMLTSLLPNVRSGAAH